MKQQISLPLSKLKAWRRSWRAIVWLLILIKILSWDQFPRWDLNLKKKSSQMNGREGKEGRESIHNTYIYIPHQNDLVVHPPLASWTSGIVLVLPSIGWLLPSPSTIPNPKNISPFLPWTCPKKGIGWKWRKHYAHVCIASVRRCRWQ